MPLSADAVIEKLKIEKGRSIVEDHWHLSCKDLPANGPEFLRDEIIGDFCRDLGLGAAAEKTLKDSAAHVREDEALSALAWHIYHCLFLNPDFHQDFGMEWLDLGEFTGRFYALVTAGNRPRLKALYREHGIPKDVADHTLEVFIGLIDRKDMPGDAAGADPHWLALFMRGDIFRLGRLQYQYCRYTGSLRVYRHAKGGEVLALSGPDIRYRADGGCAEHDWTEEPDIWASKQEETDSEITGNPIHPDGRALQREVRLRKDEWKRAHGEGDPMLALHIPGDGKLSHELCGESFRRALDFLPRHFPERPFKGFNCHSWLFDTEIQRFAPAPGNIALFQREMHVFPIPLWIDNLPWHLLGGPPKDLSQAPAGTAIQRALVSFLKSGGKLRPLGGGAFLLREDFDWGKGIYLRRTRL